MRVFIASFFAIASFFVANLNAQTIEVKKGWSLVGAQCDIDVRSELNSSIVDRVYVYSRLLGSGKWESFINTDDEDAFQGELVTINAAQGFWIKGNDEGEIVINKPNGDPTIKLQEGWNLVGAVEDINSKDVFDFGNTVAKVFAYRGDWVGADKEKVDVTEIKAGEGFWVKAIPESLSIQNLKGVDNNFNLVSVKISSNNGYINEDFEVEVEIEAKADAKQISTTLLLMEHLSGDDKLDFETILNDENRLRYFLDAGKIDIKKGLNSYNLKVKIPKEVETLVDFTACVIIDPSNSYKESNEDDNNNFDLAFKDSSLIVSFDNDDGDKAIITKALNIADYILEDDSNSFMVGSEYTEDDYTIGGTFIVEILDPENAEDVYLSACLEIGDKCENLKIWDSKKGSYEDRYLLEIPEPNDLNENEIYTDGNHSMYAEFILPQELVESINNEDEQKSVKKLRITLSDSQISEYNDENSITKEITFFKEPQMVNSTWSGRSAKTRSVDILNFRKEKIKSFKSKWVGSETKQVAENVNNDKKAYSSIYMRIKAKKVATWTGMIISDSNSITLDKENGIISGQTTTKLLSYTVHHKEFSTESFTLNKRLFSKTFVDKNARFMISVVPVGIGVKVEGHLDLNNRVDIALTRSVDFTITPAIGSDVTVRAYVGGSLDLKIGKLVAEAGVKGLLRPFIEFSTPFIVTNRFDDGLKSSIELKRDLESVKGSIRAYVDGKLKVKVCCGKYLKKSYYKSKKITSWDGYKKSVTIYKKSIL
jgi:hypothetical protein